MIDDMTVRNLSPATEQSYVYAVAKFSRFFGCSPDRLGIEEVRAYQASLGRARLVMVAHQPGLMRVALLFRRDAGPARGVRVARRSGWESVLPHRRMFPRRRALPHRP